MGRVFTTFLDEDDGFDQKYYTCSRCHTHLTLRNFVVSKSFQGRTGPAFLVTKLSNVVLGTAESRLLMTGHHVVADVSCVVCGEVLGWKYLEAAELAQRYKENKYIVEKSKICRARASSPPSPPTSAPNEARGTVFARLPLVTSLITDH
ncbi:hypothetical protein H9P43_003971 [Blastocladiella emersonii ATCC 22665]|nr:hypothetical protein H9P43_003971 [Blastocladiella emersonii ATCC 22665]